MLRHTCISAETFEEMFTNQANNARVQKERWPLYHPDFPYVSHDLRYGTGGWRLDEILLRGRCKCLPETMHGTLFHGLTSVTTSMM